MASLNSSSGENLLEVLLASDTPVPNIQRVPNQLRGIVEDSGVCGK